MANIALWLFALVIPLARQALIALGIGMVTYTGLELILSQIQNAVITSIGGLTGAAAQLAALLGFQTAVGIILAAISTKLAMATLKKWSLK